MSIIESEKSKIRYGAQRYLNSQSGLSFDGVDDYIKIDFNLNFNSESTQFSLSFWMRPRSLDNNAKWIIKLPFDGVAGSSGLEEQMFTVYFSNSNKLVVGFNLGAGPINIVAGSSFVFNENVWYHITVTFDGTKSDFLDKIKFYVNSFIIDIFKVGNGTLPITGVIKNIYIGEKDGGSNISKIDSWYNGDLSHLSLYNKALDQGEVSALHTWKGHIPESAQPNLVEYQPLQYNDFIFGSVFRVTSPSQLQTI